MLDFLSSVNPIHGFMGIAALLILWVLYRYYLKTKAKSNFSPTQSKSSPPLAFGSSRTKDSDDKFELDDPLYEDVAMATAGAVGIVNNDGSETYHYENGKSYTLFTDEKREAQYQADNEIKQNEDFAKPERAPAYEPLTRSYESIPRAEPTPKAEPTRSWVSSSDSSSDSSDSNSNNSDSSTND